MKILIDSREQRPWAFKNFDCETARGTLQTGDYSVEGLEDHISIERKSFDDFLGSIGHGRDRFMREMDRIRAYPVRALIIEVDYKTIASGLAFVNTRSRMTPNSVMGTIDSLIAYGVPVICGGKLSEFRAFNIMRLAFNKWVKKTKQFKGEKMIEAAKKEAILLSSG